VAPHLHDLGGLKPDALATYLAALGIMRLLATKDPTARGFWRDEHFVLVSELDWAGIERFFLDEYSPTPILAPWNKDGGFFSFGAAAAAEAETSPTPQSEGDDEDEEGDDDDARSAIGDPRLDLLANSDAVRFGVMRHAIAVARDAIPVELREEERKLRQAKTEKQPKAHVTAAAKRFTEIQKATKAKLIATLRPAWGTESREWLDAAVALDQEGDTGFTSLFGSGGNDGRMEFTRSLRKHLESLFDLRAGHARNGAPAQFRAAVLGGSTNLLQRESVGQFFPGRAGGTNMGAGFDGQTAINPWEFVFMLEGAVALVAGMSRRGDVEKARVSSPFWVESVSAGFSSASQQEDAPRGEQWLPLWSQPLRYDELVELVREGRAQVGRRQTTRSVDLVRATARLGLARGIDALQRFAFLERNGQSNLAVSTGRFFVASRSHQHLLDDVAPWIDRLVLDGKDKNAPKALGIIARRATEALFAVCRQEATPQIWRSLLVMLGEAEFTSLRAGKDENRRPLPRLTGAWLDAIDDGTSEGRAALRLALALASQHRPVNQEHPKRVDHVRRHFLPLVKGDARFNLDAKGRGVRDPEHVCRGRDLVTDAIALVERRSIWVRSSSRERDRAPKLPLEAVEGCAARPSDITAWLLGEISDEAVLDLVRPLLALDWDDVAKRGNKLPRDDRTPRPDALQLLFRLVHLPFAVPVRSTDGRLLSSVEVRLDPEPLRRLASGDVDAALKIAVRRLSASGLRPVFRRATSTPAFARRLAASLAFPISREDAAVAAQLVCKPYEVTTLDGPAPT